MPISDEVFQRLATSARITSQRAHCPYSHFHVGAALVTAQGEIHAGCNVENASYGLTFCAERNAIGHMIAAGATSFEAIVVYTPTAEPTTPCGACRQVLIEFNPEAEVICICDGPDVICSKAIELLPYAFVPQRLQEAEKQRKSD